LTKNDISDKIEGCGMIRADHRTDRIVFGPLDHAFIINISLFSCLFVFTDDGADDEQNPSDLRRMRRFTNRINPFILRPDQFA
jgi:hypothetical protein